MGNTFARYSKGRWWKVIADLINRTRDTPTVFPQIHHKKTDFLIFGYFSSIISSVNSFLFLGWDFGLHPNVRTPSLLQTPGLCVCSQEVCSCLGAVQNYNVVDTILFK